MSRRDMIRMSDNEVADFLAEGFVMTCASIGSNGRTHLAPIWYVSEMPTRVSSWTYGASQKVRNLRSRPTATIQVESGVAYGELRGVSMECDVEIIDDSDVVTSIGMEVTGRFPDILPIDPVEDDRSQFVAMQVPKRVGLRFYPTRIVSWDHRKLQGRF